jgi:hypothetical protein
MASGGGASARAATGMTRHAEGSGPEGTGGAEGNDDTEGVSGGGSNVLGIC